MTKPQISTGNWITIAILVGTILISVGTLQATFRTFQEELDNKADRDVVEVRLNTLEQGISEIRSDVKELLRRK